MSISSAGSVSAHSTNAELIRRPLRSTNMAQSLDLGVLVLEMAAGRIPLLILVAGILRLGI